MIDMFSKLSMGVTTAPVVDLSMKVFWQSEAE